MVAALPPAELAGPERRTLVLKLVCLQRGLALGGRTVVNIPCVLHLKSVTHLL